MCANSKPPNKTFFIKEYLGPTFVRAFHFEDRGMVMRVAPSTFKTHKISYSWDWLLTTNNVRGPSCYGLGATRREPGSSGNHGYPSPANKFSPRTISRLMCSQSRDPCWWHTLSLNNQPWWGRGELSQGGDTVGPQKQRVLAEMMMFYGGGSSISRYHLSTDREQKEILCISLKMLKCNFCAMLNSETN